MDNVFPFPKARFTEVRANQDRGIVLPTKRLLPPDSWRDLAEDFPDVWVYILDQRTPHPMQYVARWGPRLGITGEELAYVLHQFDTEGSLPERFISAIQREMAESE